MNCIDRDGSDLPPQPPMDEPGIPGGTYQSEREKGVIKLGLSFPISPHPAPSSARAPPAGRGPQHVFSTCCRWRRTSVAVSQGTTLARKELGSAFCASWIRRCMG